MPISLLIAGAIAAGSFVAGVLFRQPEINRLKKQVHILQQETERLQRIIEEQNRQICELQTRYKALKGYQFVERAKQAGRTRGALIHQYAFKEWLELTCGQASGRSMGEDETEFFNTYEAVLHGVDVPKENLVKIKEFIQNRYDYEIKHFVPLETRKVLEIVESANAA